MISNSGSTTSNLNVGQNTATNPTGAAAPQQSSPTPVPTIISSQTLESGLKIEEEKIGEGREVKSGDTIVIHYTGTLENGQKFDSSLDRNQPFETQIGVGKVIKGWDEGVIGMKVGGKRRLTIPPGLAYGEQGIQGAIPPNSTLIFELELLEIK
ncbi:MAG: FKBP-type peptidyl-prolyl cis-trans isomerase [Candidatus Levybacteria bacterium]|nr:FKBP-type peptidyl-prolyl cis-trans isomerase [Candidatus Levybacteria bacterium]